MKEETNAESEIGWVCTDCGIKYGTRVPTLATYHHGTCDICREAKPVTSARKFEYPNPNRTKK